MKKMASEEIWKPVVGFEGLYEVSNKGRVKGTRRRGCREKVLEGHPDRKGYKCLCLYKNGKHKNSKMHRLVATAFIPNPENKPFVNHIDGNVANNNVENLEWVTPSENITHAYRIGLRKVSVKTREQARKMGKKYWRLQINMRKKPVIMICKDGSEHWFESINEAARQVNGYPTSVMLCCRGERKTHKGCRWKYASEDDREDRQ